MMAHLTRSSCRWLLDVLISTAMGETGDSMFWSGSEEGGRVRSECEEDEDGDGTPTGKGR